MPFLYVGVGGMSELVVPTYYVGRQAHLCESRRVMVGQMLIIDDRGTKYKTKRNGDFHMIVYNYEVLSNTATLINSSSSISTSFYA